MKLKPVQTTPLLAALLLCASALETRTVLAASQPSLSIERSNAVAILTWTSASAVLQSATVVNGTWNDLSGQSQSSPSLIAFTNPAGFFRLRQPCLDAPSGVVSWWTGDGTASDRVSTNNGTLLGGATYAAGEAGQAFSLDGISGWVDVPNSPLLNPTGPFSVECWIQADSQQFSQQCLIVDKSHGWTDGTGWALQTAADGTAAFFYGIGGSSGSPANFPYVSTTKSVLDNLWHHLAGVWTGSQLQIYLDGELHNSLNQTNLPANNLRDVELGRSWGGGTPARFFHGKIDEVTYYSIALSSSQIRAIYEADGAGKCKL
jgi:hypothetical protein